MNKVILYGEIVSDPTFCKYDNQDYCIVSVDVSESIVDRKDPIPYAIPCDDIEIMKEHVRKCNHIGGEGFIGTHRDYKGDIRLHIVLDYIEFYFDGERGEHHEKDRL